MYANVKEAGITLPFKLKTLAAGAAGWKAKEIKDKMDFADQIQSQMGKQAGINNLAENPGTEKVAVAGGLISMGKSLFSKGKNFLQATGQEAGGLVKNTIGNKKGTVGKTMTNFIGKHRTAVGAGITGAAAGATYGAGKMMFGGNNNNTNKTASIKENNMYDLDIEYQAALNEAEFAEYMYNNAVEKCAAIEKQAYEEIALDSFNAPNNYKMVNPPTAAKPEWTTSRTIEAQGSGLGRPGVGGGKAGLMSKLKGMSNAKKALLGAGAAAAIGGLGYGAYRMNKKASEDVALDSFNNAKDYKLQNPDGSVSKSVKAQSSGLGRPGVGGAKRSFKEILKGMSKKKKLGLAAAALAGVGGAGYGAYRMNKKAAAETGLNDLVLSRLAGPYGYEYKQALGMGPMNTKNVGRRMVANMAESVGSIGGALAGAIPGIATAALTKKKGLGVGLGAVGAGLGALYGGTAAHANTARALGIANR